MSDYNAAFAAVLRRDMGGRESPFRRQVSELIKNHEVEHLFPGRNALWLQKELSKWRGRLEEERFNGTLRSLQLYCTIKGVTPNDVLLSDDSYSGPSRIEFLSEESIVTLAQEIREKNTVLPHGSALPVLYAPERMTAVFLFLHPHRRAGTDTVSLRFGISEPEGYAEEDGMGGITTALDSTLYASDLSQSDWETRLRSAYRKIEGEFNAVCDGVESPMQEPLNELYHAVPEWAEHGEDLLFTWFPVPKKKRSDKGSLDKLELDSRGFAFSAERER